MKTLSIVTPFFNEEEGVNAYFDELTKVTRSLVNLKIEYILIDDGSNDNTLDRLLKLEEKGEKVSVLELSRNFGKEAALTAGIDKATGDALIFIDADLEHPPALIKEMVKNWEDGFDVVLAQRKNREKESFIKKFLANSFYKIFNKISSFKLYPDVGEFRLMNRQSVDAVKSLTENQRFMRGIMSWVGFKYTIIKFENQERHSGTTKYSKSGLWRFAIEGIVSFSDMPLRIWTYVGLFFMAISFLYLLHVIYETLFMGQNPAGYPSLLAAIFFFGSLQLISIGIIGEYLGKTFIESKRRPIYLLRNIHQLSTQKTDDETNPTREKSS